MVGAGCQLDGLGTSAGSAHLCLLWLLTPSGGWTRLCLAVSGPKCRRGSCKACRGLGWEVIQHRFCHVLSVTVSQKPMQVQGVGKETLPLDETSGMKAYGKGVRHREGGSWQTGYHSHQSGTRLSGPPPMGTFFLIVHTRKSQLSFKTRLCYPSKQERNVCPRGLCSDHIPH